MKKLLRKLKNKKGFTLMEMLIVVAIMVILVAVSIPVFTSQINKAKEATDDANVRAAKSVVLTQYLLGEKGAGTYYYDAAKGTIETTDSGIEEYGQASDGIIKLVLDENGTVTPSWTGETEPESE